MNRSLRPHLRPGGFTLAELLAVVAIVGVLAALVFAGLSSARKKASQVRCLSGLRHVGVAILSYVSDNKGILPGPTLLGAGAAYTRTGKQSFGYLLAPYLDLRLPQNLGNDIGTVPYLQCPSREFADSENSPPSFIVQCRLPTTGPAVLANGGARPFGAAAISGSEERAPARFSELDQFGGPSRVWALIEADQMVGKTRNPAEGWQTVSDSGWYSQLPAQPVHGSTRAVLCFDARVMLMDRLPTIGP